MNMQLPTDWTTKQQPLPLPIRSLNELLALKKQVPIAYLLWFFAGWLGAHKFYLGQVVWGIVYFFTGGFFLIGWLIDLFTIPWQVRRANELSLPSATMPVKRLSLGPGIDLRSTFPLDENAITRQGLRACFLHPISWIPLVAVIAVFTLIGTPMAIGLALLAVAIGGLAIYWSRQWESITGSLRRQLVAEHNEAQDTLLRGSVEELRRVGAFAYANKLEQFALMKRQIEQRMHGDGALTPQRIQIERLLDALCFGVRDQLTALATKERLGQPADRTAALAQVDAAFATLQSIAEDIDTIAGPSTLQGNGSDPSLDEITQRLREEAEIARGVRARLRDLQAPTAFSGTGHTEI